MHKLKNDSYRKARGGYSQLLDIFCASCDRYIALYQKDGPGNLKRMYLNRILEPAELEELQTKYYTNKKEVPALECRCGNLIGVPIKHEDGRLAYRLVPGTLYKKKHK